MKLIIGLGNPGEEYEGTRHNVGFIVLDQIAKDSGSKFSMETKFNAEVAKSKVDDISVVLAKPHTFVNKSGEAVRKLKLFYKAKPEDIIVVQDDLDKEFGTFKLSFAKDSGGHRGIQSIIDNLKTNKFWRLRIGTANRKLATARDNSLKVKKEAVGRFVLSKFTPTEQAELKKLIKKAVERLSYAM
jgi:PTH1 family peptidyl-tRNA hydrolase